MVQIFYMFWVVVVFWLIIEVISSRINRNRRSGKMINDLNNDR